MAQWFRGWELSFDSMWQDVRLAARRLKREPAFAVVVIAVLATVIGLNTTLTTIVAGAVFRPWPGLLNPSEVVRVFLIDRTGQAAGFSLADYRRIAAEAHSLGAVAATTSDQVRAGEGVARATADALLVSGNFFEVLGIPMAVGRAFAPDEDRLGAPTGVVVLAYDFWRSRYGAAPDIVGKHLRLNDADFTVVGVAPREVSSSEPAYGKALFIPLAAATLLHPDDAAITSLLHKPEHCCADVVGRLAPGASRSRVRAELAVLARGFTPLSGGTARDVSVTGTEFLSHPGRFSSADALVGVTLMFAALILVWLIACANVGNLLLARGSARAGEIGLRLSLGATRRRIVRQLLIESFVLALAASVLGVAIAFELPFIVLRLVGGDSATVFPFSVTPDSTVLVYAVLLAALSAVAFGLAPALYATRGSMFAVLNEREAVTPARFRLRGALLGVQVALSIMLLINAGLLVRSALAQTVSFDPGMSVDDVMAVSFELPAGDYDYNRTVAFFNNLHAMFRQLPEDSFAFSSREPFYRFGNFAAFIRLPGEATEQAGMTQFQEVSPGFVDVLRIPLLAGRKLTTDDASGVLVNETMAKRLWPNEPALGKTFFVRSTTGDAPAPRNVVGIVRDVRTSTFERAQPMFYGRFSGRAGGKIQSPTLLIRDSGATSAAVARIVAAADPQVRVQVRPLSVSYNAMLAEARWGPLLAGLLGAFALGLATVGVFGVFAYAVRQRTREIGIRLALGCQPHAIVRLILTSHSRAVAAGLVIGLIGAVAFSMVLRNRLRGLSPFDPLTYVSVAALLTVAALAAGFVPARRASRVDPSTALRHS